jgi:hypothetical protein
MGELARRGAAVRRGAEAQLGELRAAEAGMGERP